MSWMVAAPSASVLVGKDTWGRNVAKLQTSMQELKLVVGSH